VFLTFAVLTALAQPGIQIPLGLTETMKIQKKYNLIDLDEMNT